MDGRNRIYARGIRHTAKKQKNVYQEQVDKIFKKQMSYLTGEAPLDDDSDLEDPRNEYHVKGREQHQNDSDDEGQETRKFIIEI
mmetsp:Transcript_20558/g.31309  ORF Transcript_20558/g.31309 Transcript_20558/m.31309 type:complete len:84 (-) Transcript_20558:1480-1731(-)|eukprot:CAMPEP_0170488572 /NCGR_PEP_ID=MMETSP0208-20121228/7103_1 /TAXON_ID=197538 /ORGANISM="Strombidium inclinatum, Strain S3" /LENGTH=83 /DNA_ID=CAMNT_0010763193 /DNA_START=4289 /DNA_END=4540 /DNA_ORIENTATION=+